MRKRMLRTWFLLLIAALSALMLMVSAGAVGIADIAKPKKADAIVYGTSGEGRKLMAYKFGSGKNVMVLGFAIHGFEDNWSRDGQALVYTAGELMQQLDKQTDLIMDYDWTIYVLPCMNPDGLENGYTHNGPGRCTTTYLNSSGVLVTGRGIDMNRSFPHNWTGYSGSRNYNGSGPLASKESKALADFIQKVKGSGENICIDAHGWMSQIITSDGTNKLYNIFKAKFPRNSYAGLYGGNGYFASYASDLGYRACLFEFPDGLYSMTQYQSSGYCEKFCSCITDIAKQFGDYTDRALVTAKAGSGGTVSGGGVYTVGSLATVNAKEKSGRQFMGWYDSSGKQVSTKAKYTFMVTGHMTLTAKFAKLYTITVRASASGTASGGGSFVKGDTVTVKAKPAAGKSFVGWYNVKEKRVCKTTTYKFTVTGDRTVYAMFLGDKYIDVPKDAWYRSDVLTATKRGYINGVTRLTFAPDTPMSRAMAVTVFSRLDGADTAKAAKAPYLDVNAAAWYSGAINWAYQNGVIHMTKNKKYRPEDDMTREEFITLAMRYLESKGLTAKGKNLTFKDKSQIGSVALPYMKRAYAMGLIEGDTSGRIRPKDILPRSEAVAILMRVSKYMKQHPVQ